MSVLADVAKNDSDSRVRLAAVGDINDESVLVDVAKNASDSDVRLAAVRRVSDKGVLAGVAINDSDWHVREAVVKRISDESVLVDVAKNDSDFDVRLAAVRGISDESVLGYVAKNDSNYFTWGGSSGYEGSFESAGVPVDVVTDVFGEQRDDDDLLVESTGDTTKYVALLFEKGGNVKPTRFCFFKCQLSKPSIEAETTGEDGNEPKTVTCDIKVMPRADADGYLKVCADDTTDSDAYDDFFTAVPVPTFTPPTPPSP